MKKKPATSSTRVTIASIRDVLILFVYTGGHRFLQSDVVYQSTCRPAKKKHQSKREGSDMEQECES